MYRNSSSPGNLPENYDLLSASNRIMMFSFFFSFCHNSAIIEEVAYSGTISPPSDWITLNHFGKNARITYRIRVICDEHYYNATCTVLCKPRDDIFGHYTCGNRGQKVCMTGWTGENCETPICPDGCQHGTCVRPGVCQCRNGYKGSRCDECLPYPGCKHGYCTKPWECHCFTNFGGILCDKGENIK